MASKKNIAAMEFVCRASQLEGRVAIPASKSHTIRAVVIAGLARGESRVLAPLDSADTRSAVRAMRALGADIDASDPAAWRIAGVAGRPLPRQKEVDVGNSGTTLRTVMAAAALMPEDREIILTGDEQIRRRPAGPLAAALRKLGARVRALETANCAPFAVAGKLRGGQVEIEAVTSQYVTALLLACPLAPGETRIEVPVLNEAPYVQMTLDWLAAQNIPVEREGLRRFRLPGGCRYSGFVKRMPADFSSATFFLGAGALGQNQVTCCGLDLNDSQPDKAVLDYLRAMGAAVESTPAGDVRVKACGLRGIEIDMNQTPDALPVMAVLGCFAEGRTLLRNVAHARIKETDRIAVMARELRKMGARIEELPDGLRIEHAPLHGAAVDGQRDHRVVMALALAGLNSPGETVIAGAEAAGVTFPNFAELMRSIGGHIAAR